MYYSYHIREEDAQGRVIYYYTSPAEFTDKVTKSGLKIKGEDIAKAAARHLIEKRRIPFGSCKVSIHKQPLKG